MGVAILSAAVLVGLVAVGVLVLIGILVLVAILVLILVHVLIIGLHDLFLHVLLAEFRRSSVPKDSGLILIFE